MVTIGTVGGCGNDVGISTVGEDGSVHYFLNGQEVDYHTALSKMGQTGRIGDTTGQFSLEFENPGKDFYFSNIGDRMQATNLGSSGLGWMADSANYKNDIDGFINSGGKTWK